MESVEKLTELHEIQFGVKQMKEVEQKVQRMKSLVGEINKIKLRSMRAEDIENRVKNLIKQIELIRRSAAQEKFDNRIFLVLEYLKF